MQRHFCFSMSLVFWALMLVGFSDNWLFDVGQESNSDPKMLVHAFFAFCWYSILVVQTAMVKFQRLSAHKSVGVAGVVAYCGFFLTTSFLYAHKLINMGPPAPLQLLNMTLFVYATILMVWAFWVRHTRTETHKCNIMVGTLMIVEPALSRAIGHLFGNGAEPIWLFSYVLFFAIYFWKYKLRAQLVIGFVIWLLGTINIIINMAA